MAKLTKTNIDQLIPDEKNANKGTEYGHHLIENSLRKFGAGRSILLDKNNRIIAGNKTIENAAIIGLDDIIIVETSGEQIVAVKRTDIDLDSDMGRELALADNATSKANLKWDEESIAKIVDEYEIDIEDWGVDLNWDLPDKEAIEDEFDESEISGAKNISVLGDLYEIGNHRLLCGDSTSSDDVEKLMAGKKADIGFTSPPYNAGNADFTYDYKAKKSGGFYSNDLSKEEYAEMLFAVLNNYLLNLNEKSHSLFWNVMYNANSRDDYGKIIFSDRNPLRVRETIIWDKKGGFPVAGDNILSRRTEFIFLLSNSEKYRTNQHNRTIYWNLWEVPTAGSQDEENKHKAMFPVGLPHKGIQDFSKEKDIVLDLFLGAGTTMLASHQLNRACYGMELDPHYCDVTIKRMLKYDKDLIVKRNGECCKSDFM